MTYCYVCIFCKVRGTNVTITINTTLEVEDGNNFQLRFYASDSAGNFGINDTTFFTVDTTSPEIDYLAATEANNSNFTRDWVYVNISVTETNRASTTYVLFNSTGQWNSTIYSTSVDFINFTGLGDGVYYYNVTVNDTVGNSNTTETRFITLDNTAPVISLPVFTNGTFKKNTDTLTINISTIDLTLTSQSCVLNINGTNQTFLVVDNWCNTTNGNLTNLADGNQTITIFTNDTVDNGIFNTTFIVQIDTTNPLITYNGATEANNSNFTRDWVYVNVTVTETNRASTTYVLFNSTGQWNSTIYSTSVDFINFTGLGDGVYYYNVTVNDTVGNSNTTETRFITLDNTAPTHSNNQTNTTSFGRAINFSILWNDAIALDPNGQYIFSTNNTGTWVNDSQVNFTATPEWANVTKTLNSTVGLLIGYQWYANDSIGNSNNTGEFTLTTTGEVYNCENLTTAGATYTLQNDILGVVGTCFNITTNNITLDGNGFTINGDDTGTDYGVWSTGTDNLTIKNFFNITDFSRGIGFESTNNSLITNNTASSNIFHGIFLDSSSNNNQITNNNASLNGNSGIILDSSSNNNTITNNTASSNSVNGISLTSSSNNTITNNTASSNNRGILLFSSSNSNTITNNTLNSNIRGILLSSSSNNNQLLNNEITGSTTIDIDDTTTNSEINYLIYNNSFGEIRWANLSNNGFLKNLSTLGNIGLTINLSIGNNTAFLNASAFSGSLINSSVNITLYGMDSFSFTDPVVLRNGLECTNDECYNFTHLDAATIKFNVTYAGANYTIGESNTAPTITFVEVIPAVTPNESGVNYTVFNFTATDTNGFADINTSSAQARFQLSGETTRLNTSCVSYQTGGNQVNFTCTVGLYYFDKNDANWIINVTVKDNSNLSAENSSTTFQFNLLTSMVTGGALAWDTLTLVATNTGADNNPIIVNNTGNANDLFINITAFNLEGLTTPGQFIFAANISVENITQGCTGPFSVSMINGTTATDQTNITSARLQSGNNSLSNSNATSGQEELFFCITAVNPDLSAQDYSSDSYGAWTIKIFATAFLAFIGKKRKKKKVEDDKLLEAFNLITDELKEEYSLNKKEIIQVIIEKLKTKYKVTKKEILEIIREDQEINIPITIFSKELGGLETITKYMKENLNMSYSEIAEELNRDERTIWTAYKKAKEKQKESIKIKETEILVPTSILKDRKLTILESIIVYLKEKGMKYSEIAELLDRDQRNIWTVYSRAKKKLKLVN